MESSVKGDEPAAEQFGKGNVLGVVGLCPSELTGDPPGVLSKPAWSPLFDRASFEALLRGSGVTLRYLATPQKLVQRRARLGPHEAGRDERFSIELREAVRAVARRDCDARVDDEHSVPASRPSDRRNDVRERAT